jgi:hypothetical protein
MLRILLVGLLAATTGSLTMLRTSRFSAPRASSRAGDVRAIGNFFSFGGGGRGVTEFLKLSSDERVAMVKVSKCIAPGEGEGPLGKPVYKPAWATPTNETWAEVRAEYPVLESLSDETLEACLVDIKAM